MEKTRLALDCVQDRMEQIVSQHLRLRDEDPKDAMLTGGVSKELDYLREAQRWLEFAAQMHKVEAAQ